MQVTAASLVSERQVAPRPLGAFHASDKLNPQRPYDAVGLQMAR